MRDGDGWQRCDAGHQHWGRYGAAGLLVHAHGRVLLQHRAPWSHQGDTWGVPGGARGSTETAEQAALREAAEETGLDASRVRVATTSVDDHGGWSYTTVVASADELLEVHSEDRESTAVRWVRVDAVAELPLHPGFAAAWPSLRSLLQDLPDRPATAT